MSHSKRWAGVLSALAVGGTALLPSARAEDAACIAATYAANAATTSAISAEIVAMETAIVFALQAVSGEITSTLRGMGSVQAGVADAQNAAATNRDVQSDRVDAAKDFQFSGTVCQAASLTLGGAQADGNAQQGRSAASGAAAQRSAGTASGTRGVEAAVKRFDGRKAPYCDPSDPACDGKAGAIPNGDRRPGDILAKRTLVDDKERAQARDVVLNLTVPVPLPPLGRADVLDSPEGRLRHAGRGAAETQMNLAADPLTEILERRRAPTLPNTEYNEIAVSVGLPAVTGNVSVEDMEFMRWHGRFQGPAYATSLAGQQPDGLAREHALLMSEMLQQGYRTQKLLEEVVLLLAAAGASDAYKSMMLLQTRAADVPLR